MKIIYIARKFPPCVGGMERVAKELYDHLVPISDVTLVKPKSDKRTPLSVPLLFFKTLKKLIPIRPDVIYLQDAMLSPLIILGKIFSVPVVIQVHGLDVTYKKLGYQRFIIPFLRKAELIVSVSESTKEECVKRGSDPKRIVVIPNGIDIPRFEAISNGHSNNAINRSLPEGKIILSVGRLVERKGYHWFVENVMPKIWAEYPDVSYVLVGDGVMRPHIINILQNHGWEEKIFLMGKVSTDELIAIFKKASVFVSPNIPKTDDKEGFGISNIEATYFGLPVVASNVDGIPDAILDGITGFLIEPFNSTSFSRTVIDLLQGRLVMDQSLMRSSLIANYSWNGIALRYISAFSHISDSIN